MSDHDPILEMYIYESTQMIEQTESVVLDCENAGAFSAESINEIFRSMHTLKGSSAMMQYMHIADTAHAVEDLFHLLREKQFAAVDFKQLSDLILQSVDFFKEEMRKIVQGKPADGSAAALITKIQQFLTHGQDQQPTDHNSSNIDDEPLYVYQAILHFTEDCEMVNIRAFQLVHHLEEVTYRYFHSPSDLIESINSVYDIRDRGFHLILESPLVYEEMHQLLMKTTYLSNLELSILEKWPGEELSSFKVPAPAAPVSLLEAGLYGDDHYPNESKHLPQDEWKPPAMSEPKPYPNSSSISCLNAAHADSENTIKTDMNSSNEIVSNASASNTVASLTSTSTTAVDAKPESQSSMQQIQQVLATSRTTTPMISVHVDKLDQLMDLVGELVIAEAMVTNSDGLHINYGGSQLLKASGQLRKITSELQDTVMSIRMIPLAATFHKMRRVSRDMSHKLGKEIQFHITGEDTEIDKSVIDQISDPLMHLVRNAIDHGIESAEERLEAGKPATGTVTLEAKNVGSDVLVIIKDDGKGIDRDKIVAKAIKNSLLDPAAADISDREAFQLIFHPGLSTKEQITEFSGRGVGMDVVRSNIEQVGGVIYVDSESGHGTTITLKIPLTLAIIDGMNVRVGSAHYTLPTTSIKESFRPEQKDLFSDPDGNKMVKVRGEVYSIVDLHERFLGAPYAESFTQGVLIMVEQDSKSLCLFVDDLLGQQQVVIKPLPAYFRRLNRRSSGLSGCTLLGDGSISLILNMTELTNYRTEE